MSQQPDIFEYKDYLQQRYGEILHRVPIDAGFSCPNRGPEGSGGCIFCPDDGARAVQLGDTKKLEDQICKGIRFARRRYKATAFMAYLQTFTNTFASVEELDTLIRNICGEYNFRAITFGTRPDCLQDKILDYLQQLQKKIDVWIELGVQSSHNTTLQRINRGHDWAASKSAIQRIHAAGLSTGVHLILGLPGENEADYLETINRIAALPIQAIKLHNLHIIKGTRLAELYAQDQFPVYNEHEYIETLLRILPHIPATIPLIRLTTDTEPDKLIAPRWSMSKGQFRKQLARQMRARCISQGMALRTKNARSNAHSISRENDIQTVTTKDGSITFFNNAINEHYHTLAGARSEAIHKYCKPARLPQLLARKKLDVLDVCFGLGYNSLTSCEYAMEHGGKIDITALEIDKNVVEGAAQYVQETATSFDWNHCLAALARNEKWQEKNCAISLILGDARFTAGNLPKNHFDLIWLDAFSTRKNSELWTVDFFATLHHVLKPKGILFTYSAAIPVRAGLREAGFKIAETPAFGRERGGTAASPTEAGLANADVTSLPERDLFLLTTVKATPYRDPDGTRTHKEILRAREYEIVTLKEKNKS